MLLRIILLLIVSCAVQASPITHLLSKNSPPDFENLNVEKLYTDKNSTVFLLRLKSEVKPHRHEKHTETVYVLSGRGDFTLNGITTRIKAGDLIVIPESAVHSVIVTSKEPLTALSVQSPEFFGADRIFVEETEN